MHQEPHIEIPDRSLPDRGRFNFALILAAVAVLVIVGALYFLPGRQSPPGDAPRVTRFAFGAAEQAYAARMRIENIALREARPVLKPGSAPLVEGQRRGFEVSFEHIPASWNMQQPAVRVSGLQF
jgi:hypothetical protein